MNEMPDPKSLDKLAAQLEDWEQNEVAAFLRKQAERREEFFTSGDIPVKRVYTAADTADIPLDDIGLPGRYPFTRGPYPTMYRSRHWTMRQIAGFGTGEDTNKRFQYLIRQGQTGLSTDFDMPTLMGYDSDHPMSEGEVGREGVAVDTLADVEALYDGIDLENISVSMTINPSAWILLAMYVAMAKKRGLDLHRLSGTIQADILKEYMAQKEYCFPIGPSVRIVRDCITYCAEHMRRYNPINISGYHISEAGASPLQEAAFTIANGMVYVDEVLKTGMDVDKFASRLAFYFVSQGDFFEEIAKFRAARRVWAKVMKDRFGAKSQESNAAALSLSDRRRYAHQAAIPYQYRAHRAAGAVRGARRLPVAAHQRLRRSVRHPDRGRHAACAAHPADHRRGDQCLQRGRSARRQLFRRKPDQRIRAADFRHSRLCRWQRRHHQID